MEQRGTDAQHAPEKAAAGASRPVPLKWVSRLGVPVWAVVYLASAVVCCLLAAASPSHFVDLRVYRLGGQVVRHGGNLYHAQYHGLPFTYPPFAALIMVPLSALPWVVAVTAMTVASVVALPAVLYLALRLPPAPSWLLPRDATRLALAVAAAAIWLEPVRSELGFGQVDLLLAVAVLFDLVLPDSARFKGTLIGVAAGIKLTPAIFAVYLLVTRRYKAAATAAAAFAATAALGFTVAPGGSVFFWNGTFLNPSRVSSIQSGQNESLLGALARNLHSASVTGAWLPLALLVAVCGLGLAALAQRGGDEGLGFSLAAITGLLVSPISWTHHWVIAVPVLLLAGVTTYRYRATRPRPATIASAAAIAVAAVIGWSKVARYHGGHWLSASPARVAASEVYVLAGLAGLVIAATALRHRARARQASP